MTDAPRGPTTEAPRAAVGAYAAWAAERFAGRTPGATTCPICGRRYHWHGHTSSDPSACPVCVYELAAQSRRDAAKLLYAQQWKLRRARGAGRPT